MDEGLELELVEAVVVPEVGDHNATRGSGHLNKAQLVVEDPCGAGIKGGPRSWRDPFNFSIIVPVKI